MTSWAGSRSSCPLAAENPPRTPGSIGSSSVAMGLVFFRAILECEESADSKHAGIQGADEIRKWLASQSSNRGCGRHHPVRASDRQRQ
jgi:hypothetical protein